MVTTSIPITDIAGPSEPRRNGNGQYLVVPPGGDKPVGYSRVTTIAKILDDGGGLAPWKAAMALQGLILRKGLRADLEALMASHNGDPWYSGEDSKKALKKLVEECCEVGGASDRRRMGSALHTITALMDLGRAPGTLSDETMADLKAYRDGLAAFGISIVPGQIEVNVVLDDYHVAGILDRIVTVVPGYELPLIGDLKTGGSLEYSWQQIAVQLAAYSRANAVYAQGPSLDGSEDRRLPMPEVDQHTGLIFWLKAGQAELEVIAVDLDAGWEAFEKSMWTRGWRRRRVNTPLGELLSEPDNDPARLPAEPPPDLSALLEASAVDQVQQTFPGAVDETPQSVTTPPPSSTRDWLQARIDRIGATPGARTTLQARWPAGVPTLKRSSDHTPAQLKEIGAVVDDVEARHRMPFGDPEPGPDTAPANVLDLFPTKPKEQQ